MKIEDKLREMAGRLITGAMEDGDVEVGVLCEAADMIEMQGWRTIESAPKDGTQVLFTHWNYAEQGYLPIISGRWLYDQWCCDILEKGCTPTHWRPIPDPPSSPPHGTMVSEEQ